MRLSKVAGVLVIVIALAAVTSTAFRDDIDFDPGLSLAILGLAVLGGFIAIRRPGNRMAWVLGGIGLVGCLAGTTPLEPHPDQVMIALIGGVGWYLTFYGTVGLLPLLFPTGRALSRRWSIFGWIGSGAAVIFALGWLLQDEVCLRSIEEVCQEWTANPIGIAGLENPEDTAFGLILFGFMLIAVIGAIISLVIRFRRAAPIERLQIKWLLYAASLMAIWILVSDMIGPLLGVVIPERIYDVIHGLLWVAFPVSAGIAILKYRLFDIDRIVSRTVTYAVVVGLLAAAYFGAVGLLTEVIPVDGNLAVAASTLGAAALFNPLRRRVQKAVDHRFNRARYDADRVVEDLSNRLRSVTDIEGVVGAGIAAAAETVEPTTTSLWVRPAPQS